VEHCLPLCQGDPQEEGEDQEKKWSIAYLSARVILRRRVRTRRSVKTRSKGGALLTSLPG
jgi:hypothetical protein